MTTKLVPVEATEEALKALRTAKAHATNPETEGRIDAAIAALSAAPDPVGGKTSIGKLAMELDAALGIRDDEHLRITVGDVADRLLKLEAASLDPVGGEKGRHPGKDALPGAGTHLTSRPPGHCQDDKAWAEFVRQNEGRDRDRLAMGHVSDFALANEQYLLDGNLHVQTAVKERIRWLSIRLAQALHVEAESVREPADGWIKFDGDDCPVEPGVKGWVRLRGDMIGLRVGEPSDLSTWRWDRTPPPLNDEGDIVAYALADKDPQHDQ